ncbi:MAG: DUF6356 family protein [Rhizobiaceae bacterium]|nr:DUF6356 family protein [Rhizobiaceae bacterium]MCV0405081.1 DUF6356 family protein [Rhizobiaceae bacterium]
MNVPQSSHFQEQIGTFSATLDAILGVKQVQEVCTVSRKLARLFIDHPASVGESYLGHMSFAAWFASRLFLAAGAALVHAILPFACQTTASRIVRELHERIAAR